MAIFTEPLIMKLANGRIYDAQNKDVIIRPIHPDDAEAIHQMHQRLSPESLYFRYLQFRSPTIEEFERVCHLDPTQGAGFVAVTKHEQSRIVGVAYYLLETVVSPGIAEPGIVIDDQFQGQGIGRRLWHKLQQHAQRKQIQWLRILTHPSNQAMLALVKGSNLPYQATYSHGLTEYLVTLHEELRPSPVTRMWEQVRGATRHRNDREYGFSGVAIQTPGTPSLFDPSYPLNG